MKHKLNFKKLKELAILIMLLLTIYSCKTTAPVVIKEKEYIIISNYCDLIDFIFKADDILNFNEIYLNNITIIENDSNELQLQLNKNISYSPDGKYYVEFSFVPSRNDFLVGTCKATVYKKDKSLVSILKDVYPNEKVLWFEDFAIFEGFGSQFSRKIIIDLKTGYSKEIGLLGNFDLIGKSSSAAFYLTPDAGAAMDNVRVDKRYSVISLSKDETLKINIALENELYPYFYNESNSVIYNSETDTFKVYLEKTPLGSFKAKSYFLPFDETNYDSTTYILINKSKLYKIDDAINLLSNFTEVNKKLDLIKEIRVLENKVLFKSIHEIKYDDLTQFGNYTTKNKLSFNIKDTRIGNDKWFKVYVVEFGILDIDKQVIYYPSMKILN